MKSTFNSLPDSARIWINPAGRTLTGAEQDRILDLLREFIRDWSSHGRKVIAEVAVLADRFIVTAAYVEGGDVSGCGIDASVHALSDIADAVGLTWASALHVFFRRGDGVEEVDRSTFAKLASEGTVTPDTIVYDVSITTLGELRQEKFELPARRSWHARAFRFEAQTA